MLYKFLNIVVALLLAATAAYADVPSPKCGIVGTVCSDGPATRMVNGYPAYRACWKEDVIYACIQPGVLNTCGDAIARGATHTGMTCTQPLIVDGTPICLTEEHEYTTTTPGTTNTVANCASQQFCISGNCFDSGSVPDPDFAKAVTGMEVTRQAGGYLDANGITLFAGEANTCNKTILKNCCVANGSTNTPLSNFALIAGSAYAFDILGAPRSALFSASFNPAAFAIGILTSVVNAMLSCSSTEVLTAVKRDKSLCMYVGEYCSKSIKIIFKSICIQDTEAYCCYNSKLSLIMNKAFKSQTGSGWGSGPSPSCGGMTVTQFQSLDFSLIDFSSFYADIKPDLNANSTSPAAITTKVPSCIGNKGPC